jgi:hypothetical protein
MQYNEMCRCRFRKSAAKTALLLTDSKIGSDGGVINCIYIYIYGIDDSTILVFTLGLADG